MTRQIILLQVKLMSLTTGEAVDNYFAT